MAAEGVRALAPVAVQVHELGVAEQAGELADIQQRTARALDPGPLPEAIAQSPDQAPVLGCGGGRGQAGGERLRFLIQPFGVIAQVRQRGHQDRRNPGSRSEPAAGPGTYKNSGTRRPSR